ncbi:MAG: septum formation initiator family protein [Bryobacteraceae bacterium]
MKSFARRFAYSVAVLMIAGYAFFALRGPNGIPGLIDKRHQIQELEKRNSDLAKEIEQKRARIARLRENQTEQEMEIRQRLKLVKPNEKVFILQDDEKK